ncbi:hypothetical protein [Methylobacterium sp.]|uniref:hypothetical protein n=1 Tax=Methylobacterium sp. TaxID=409 RepID=UPI000FC06A6B|nr:hypothetical protein [Methylobacterium sp.]RUP22318.1 MAG: hypothetical protein EKK44_05425 [Methylobacterium sp.]
METDTETRLYGLIEDAHKALKAVKREKANREAGRSFAMVATKLDEARLWLGEALDIASMPEVADGERP